MARKKPNSSPTNKSDRPDSVAAYRHSSKRKNIPSSGIEAQGVIREAPKIRYEYNPHLPPVLRSSNDPAATDQLPELLQAARQRALSEQEARLLAAALKNHQPWLEWSGKREKPWFEVDPVALHIHERVSTQAILRVLAREDVQRDLFADPQQEYARAVQFYQHDVDWANRMILGDSLQVMASLAQREDLAGKIQMIYFDPPYGIKFSSNFQPQLGQRDVKDREQDLTREPETVRAYRDTWTLGVHSYLAYLRDRLAMARELLADTGSIFVQISDENLHRVRCLMDEVFKANNFIAQVTFRTTSSLGSQFVGPSAGYLLWYGRDKTRIKYRPIFKSRGFEEDVGGRFTRALLPNGTKHVLTTSERNDISTLPDGSLIYRHDNLTSQSGGENASFQIAFQGLNFRPGRGYWKTNLDGISRLIRAERVAAPTANSLTYVRFLDDFPLASFTEVWTDTQTGAFTESKIYVVQTNTKVIERCLMMTTDPGDLVLDPTCGSGTTAYVSEQWGRRWITIDTSRVALALAKQRLLTARFPYYKLRAVTADDLSRDSHATWLGDPAGETSGKCTFACKSVPHVTLKSIARNNSLDPIFAKHEPILAEKVSELNKGLKKVSQDLRQKLNAKLLDKQKREGKKAITEADRRRWQLPDNEWKEWEVPFDTDSDWPGALQSALTVYRKSWREKMDEVNACIAANAEMEELVDKPDEIRGIVRVSGPFTVEGVIALEEGPDTPIGGAPDEELETFETAGDIEVANAEAHLDKILRLLKASGVDFPGNRNMKFERLEPNIDATLIHAVGEWVNGESAGRRVAVSVGPEVGNLSTWQVEEVIRIANRKGFDDVVFAAFGFDASAQTAIEEANHPNLRVHMALIRPDVAMGDLLKTQPGSQIFTVFTAPRVKKPVKLADGQHSVEVQGMDLYDPVTNTIQTTGQLGEKQIAAWFLDTDYDGRTFCICQAFFPDKAKWSKLARALGDRGVIDEEKFEALSKLESLPF